MDKKNKLLVRKIMSLSKLALVITLAAVALRMVLILRQADSGFGPRSAVAAPDFSELKPVSKSPATPADYAAIFEKSIFKGAAIKFEPETTSVLPEASELLGMQLSGTIAGSPGIARAIIKDLKTNMPGLYKIGDKVRGATIEKIENNYVVLLLDSQMKVLNLYTKEGTQSKTDSRGLVAMKQDVSAIAAGAGSETETKTYSQFSGIERVLKTAIIEPNRVGGKVEGLSIENLGNSEIAAALGFKNGDVINAVNNQKLTSTQKAFQVLKKARSQTAITVNLSRDGKPETLSFPLR
jgi:type II secretion system protein C